jgi:hypothetical protein
MTIADEEDVNAAAGGDEEQAEGEDNTENQENDNEVGEDTATPEIKALATKMGWRDDWDGEADNYVGPEEFITAGQGRLKTTLRKQDERHEKQTADIAEMRKTMDEFAKFNQGAEKRAYDQALADLKSDQRQAVEDGDTAAYDAAETQIGELDKNRPEEKPAENKGTGNEAADAANYDAFKQDNSWYGTDMKMSAYADQIAPHVGQQYQGPEYYKQLTEEVKKEFPDNFGNTKRRKAPNVEGGTGETHKGGAKGWGDLDSEAQAACTRFIKQGMYVDDDGKPMSEDKARAKYVKDYFAQETA